MLKYPIKLLLTEDDMEINIDCPFCSGMGCEHCNPVLMKEYKEKTEKRKQIKDESFNKIN